jgi:hypothetical protein
MRPLTPRIVVLAIALGLLGAAAALTSGASAAAHRHAPAHAVRESGQPVIDWNEVLLSIVNTPGAQPANIQPPRNFAILHVAIYDAVNSIDQSHEPYRIAVHAPRGASETAAADAAAHDALVGLYPAMQGILDSDYTAELAKVPDGPAKDEGVAVGQTVAHDVLAIRADDGSATPAPPYVPGTSPGDFQPSPPNLPTAVFTTWGQVRPFVLASGSQFRVPPPPALTSPEYAAALNEVQSLGSATSTTRTADQTQIGLFWNPPIQNFWNGIADEVAAAHQSDLPTTARLLRS